MFFVFALTFLIFIEPSFYDSIPDSHRRDQELFQFFEAVFPGQVKRAELLLNATELTNLMKKRQALLEKYEKIYAKFSYEKKRHWQKKEGNFTDLDSSSWECLKCRSCRDGLKKPKDPTMKLGKSNLFCCGKKVVKALPHILAEIKSLNRRIETEFKKVAKDKQLVEDREEHNDLFHKTVDTAKAMLTGKGDDLMVRVSCRTSIYSITNKILTEYILLLCFDSVILDLLNS